MIMVIIVVILIPITTKNVNIELVGIMTTIIYLSVVIRIRFIIHNLLIQTVSILL